MTALPDSIIQNGLFCCWKYEERNGRKTKVPYQPETGLGAKSNDPSSFVPYKTAVQASGYDGIGIGIFNGICAIDLDNCLSDSGYYTQTAAEIVALMHSYTEYSPSGNGLYILFSAKGFQYDTKRFYIMNHQAGIEVYVAGVTNKYVTVTGNRYEDYEYGDRTQELQALLDKFMRRPEVGAENAFIFGLSAEEVIRYENEGGYNPTDYFNNDQDIRRVLMQLINGEYSNGDMEMFRDIYDSLLNTNSSDRADTYFILADFKSYAAAQKKVEEAYRDEEGWAKMALLNTACSGKFTSDRTIQQYVDEIWHLDHVTVKVDPESFEV